MIFRRGARGPDVGHEPSDQMIDVLCAMNRGGFPVADMMKVIGQQQKSGG
jgi:hypothetical protein